MASDDPDLETKAADIVGLYLNPPQDAAVFCVDEKSAFKRWIDWTRSYRFRRAQEFVDFLDQVVDLCKPNQEIHIIVDNLSAHTTPPIG